MALGELLHKLDIRRHLKPRTNEPVGLFKAKDGRLEKYEDVQIGVKLQLVSQRSFSSLSRSVVDED